MLLSAIVQGVNVRLAGERLSYMELVPYLDMTIDDINTQLNACFPAFSELPVNTAIYDCFPDKYIRTCVMPGAAMYYYAMDEEGAQPPTGLQQTYLQNLFYMLRDYLQELPLKYQASDKQGTVQFDLYGDHSCYIPCQYVTPMSDEDEDKDAEVEVVQITIGNTITLPYGSQCSVVNKGTPEKPILEFALAEGPQGQTGPSGPAGPQGPTGLQGIQGPPGQDGTFRSMRNLVLNLSGWALATPSQITALNLAPSDYAPTHAYVMNNETVRNDDMAILFGPDSSVPLFRKCLTSEGQITFFVNGAPTEDIIIDAVVLF